MQPIFASIGTGEQTVPPGISFGGDR